MKYLFADFETSDSHVNSLCILEGAFILCDENFIDKLVSHLNALWLAKVIL